MRVVRGAVDGGCCVLHPHTDVGVLNFSKPQHYPYKEISYTSLLQYVYVYGSIALYPIYVLSVAALRIVFK